MRPKRHLTFSISIQNARGFRKNSTASERILWNALRNRGLAGLKFRRQYPVGQFVLDFFCLEKSLAVEVDGKIHKNPATQNHDRERDKYLSQLGIRIIRVFNDQVLHNLEFVLNTIQEEANR
jgi:very-short-patch-repair endonuclease